MFIQYVYVYNNLRLQSELVSKLYYKLFNNTQQHVYMCMCIITWGSSQNWSASSIAYRPIRVYKKLNSLKLIKLLQIDVKCYDILALSTCQQLYGKVIWLAALACEWPVLFRMADGKHVCVLRLLGRVCSLISVPMELIVCCTMSLLMLLYLPLKHSFQHYF